MRIVHTSATEIGQIYIPQINAILGLATCMLVLFFRSSSALAAAYGVAVTSTMLITSLLFLVVAETRFGWPRLPLIFAVAVFLAIESVFFGANLVKIAHGAWFPLLIGVAAFTIMTTWRKGRMLLAEKLRDRLPNVEEFFKMTQDAQRVHGRAVFLTSDPDVVPASILHNLKHNRILHQQTALLSVVSENVPRVPRSEKVRVAEIGPGFRKITAHYGFLETPSIPHVLALAREQGLDFDLDQISFFLSSARLVPHVKSRMSRWRQKLFSFLYRNSLGATAYFDIPPTQVVEIGTQVPI
jgi:KUP system potassium uptake protein